MFFCYFILFIHLSIIFFFFFFQAEAGIRDFHVTGVQTCALPISTRFPDAAVKPRCMFVTPPRADVGMWVSIVRMPPGPTPTGHPVVSTGMGALNVLRTVEVQTCRVTPVTAPVPAALSKLTLVVST